MFKTFGLIKTIVIFGLLSLISACSTPEKAKPADPSQVVFAVLGDYGNPDNVKASRLVSRLVKSWQPAFIATVGDNNYPNGAATTIDANVGKYYSDYIYPYKGSFGKGSADGKNHFYPAIGNHDYLTDAGNPYFDYFSLSDNNASYDVNLGLIHLVIMDSNLDKGLHKKSPQGLWVRNILETSSAKWKIVLLHHPPSSSGRYGGYGRLRWPFQEWGATTVIAGHEHFYERIDNFGIPYFINGLGGAGFHKIIERHERSIVHYNDNYGAMRVTADSESIRLEFINVNNEVIDQVDLPVKE